MTTISNTRSQGGRVFIAWSEKTESAAKCIHHHLEAEGLSPWLSDEIQPGKKFREEIRHQILEADLVIAVFPELPSYWLAAEAGLAYFEQKLLPIVIEQDLCVEPFSELHVHELAREDVDRNDGETIRELVTLVKERLGHGEDRWRLIAAFRKINRLFLAGVPIVGAAIVCALAVWGFLKEEEEALFHLLRASHTVLGAIVYGGAAFVALFFSHVGTSASFAGRQFVFSTARRLFFVWLTVSIAQLLVGFYLLYVSHSDIEGIFCELWINVAILCYLFALIACYGGYDLCRSANQADQDEIRRDISDRYIFFSNLLFGIGLTLLTIVIVLMSLKDSVKDLIM